MKILMFSVGFAIFILYIVGYLMLIAQQNKIQANKLESNKRRRNYPNHGMDKLDDFIQNNLNV
jgi:hypothetical protein